MLIDCASLTGACQNLLDMAIEWTIKLIAWQPLRPSADRPPQTASTEPKGAFT